MSKRLLITSGDSWTDQYFRSDFHPEIDTSWKKWPEILGDMLDLKVINVAKCGAGNHYIYSSVLDEIVKHDPKDIGYVIVGWSQCQRHDYENVYMRTKRRYGSNNYQSYNFDWGSDRLKTRGHILGWLNESIRLFYSLNEVCKNNSIRLKQFQMIQLYSHYHKYQDGDKNAKFHPSHLKPNNWWEQQNLGDSREEFTDRCEKFRRNSPYYKKILQSKSFSRWPDLFTLSDLFKDHTSFYTISDRDVHPNNFGQEKIANYINENL